MTSGVLSQVQIISGSSGGKNKCSSKCSTSKPEGIAKVVVFVEQMTIAQIVSKPKGCRNRLVELNNTIYLLSQEINSPRNLPTVW
jgi:hypothetical protein